MSKKKDTIYKQCELSTRVVRQVAWIPGKLAKVGRVLEFKQEDGSWGEGWTVLNVWGSQDFSHLDRQNESQRDFAHKLSYKKDRRTT